ncbi:sugar phosphate isomerase/epimerase family protein [Cohnella herbarum]|nr:sugar phosphate isomerase/epimerase family protein [Cohnella herbarum]
MNYAFVSFSCPDADLLTVLRMAQQYGYSGFEARCDCGHRHGIELDITPEQIIDIKTAFQASGVKLQCISVSCRYSNPVTVQANITETIAYIRLAQALEVPFIRIFCGYIPEGAGREETRTLIVESLRSLAASAAQAGVVLAVETHDDWSDPLEMAAIMSAVNHPSIGVVWDIMHTYRTGKTSMEEAYRILQPWIHHVHIHDGSLDPDTLVFLPIGTGDIDHKEALRILIQHKYTGFLSGEWLDWEPASLHLPREIEAMRGYEKELLTE